MAYQCSYCYRNAVKIGSKAWCSIHLPKISYEQQIAELANHQSKGEDK